MKANWLKIILFGYSLFTLVGCAQVANSDLTKNVTPSTSDMTSTALVPPQGDSTPMPSTIPTPAVSGMEKIIEIAKADLAQRLAISTDQVLLVEATEVEWSDSSLDCPQPDMSYLQVITPGYRILLQANSTQYEYHSNRDAYVVYCENTNLPGLPKP